jgi:hypothetical protein
MSNYANFKLVAINDYSYTAPKSSSSKLINKLADMSYTDMNSAIKAIENYKKTGKIAKPRKGQ